MKNKDDPKKLEKQLAEIADNFARDGMPKLRAATFVVGVILPNPDPFVLMQIGAAVLLDKPLILVGVRGAWLPKKARDLAEAVIEVDDGDSLKTAEGQARMKAAMRKVMAKVQRDGRPQ